MSESTAPNPDYPTQLIDRLKAMMTDEIIRVIGMSDYGKVAPEHEAAIRRIIDEPRIPRPMRWEPGEALALTRWWTPETHKKHEIRALSIDKAHIARAFSCFCLLAAGEYGPEESGDSIPGLLESCHAIDPDLVHHIPELLDWVSNTNSPPGTPVDSWDHAEIVACACGKLIGACMTGQPPQDIEQIARTIEMVKHYLLVTAVADYWTPIEASPSWIHDQVLSVSVAGNRWVRLAKRWLLDPPRAWDRPTRDTVIKIGTLMLPRAKG